MELTGPIVEGDAERLELALEAANKKSPSRLVRWLVLNSPGGDVLEAVRLADVVRSRLLWTSNLNIVRYGYGAQEENEAAGYLCASSCFLVLAAGGNRVLVSKPEANARIGLHRPYLERASYAKLPLGEIARRQQDAEEAVRAFARRERVPEALVDRMMDRSSAEVYWLSRKDLMDLSGYASWYEEVKIAVCGWDKAYQEAASNALRSITDARAERIQEDLSRHLGRVQDCVDRATRRAQRRTDGPTPGAKEGGGR